jgi:hypothetical protein
MPLAGVFVGYLAIKNIAKIQRLRTTHRAHGDADCIVSSSSILQGLLPRPKIGLSNTNLREGVANNFRASVGNPENGEVSTSSCPNSKYGSVGGAALPLCAIARNAPSTNANYNIFFILQLFISSRRVRNRFDANRNQHACYQQSDA